MSDTETLDKFYLEWSQFTSAKTRREIELERELAEVKACSMSWSGFNIHGDRASRDEVASAVHAKSTIPAYRQRVADLERELAKSRENVDRGYLEGYEKGKAAAVNDRDNDPNNNYKLQAQAKPKNPDT